MGRGGGHSHSSHSHSSHSHSSSSRRRRPRGSGGSSNGPDILGTQLLVLGIMLGAVAIAVPVSVHSNPVAWLCAPGESLNYGEQMVCIPRNVNKTLIAEFGSKGKGIAKLYKTSASLLENASLTFRSVSYKEYSTSYLSEEFDDFTISVPVHVSVSLSVTCKGSACDGVELYWYNSSQYDTNCKYGVCDGSYNYKRKGFSSDPQKITLSGDGSDVFHLIFLNSDWRWAKITYDIDLKYTVYDLSHLSAVSFPGTSYEITDYQPEDAFIMDYPSTKTAAENDDWFYAFIGTKEFNWAAIYSIAIIFGILTLACVGVAVVLYIFACKECFGEKKNKAKEDAFAHFRINDDLVVDASHDKLELKGKKLGDLDMIPICSLLRIQNGLFTLSLSDNEIGKEGVSTLCQELKANTTLLTLELDGNKIGTEGAILISDMLTVNSKLQIVNLKSNHIEDEGIIALSQALQRNTALLKLDVSENKAGESIKAELSSVSRLVL